MATITLNMLCESCNKHIVTKLSSALRLSSTRGLSIQCTVFQSLGLLIRDVTMRSLAKTGNTLLLTGKYSNLTTLLNFARVTRMEEYGFIFKTLLSTSVYRNNMILFLPFTLQLTIISRNT